MAAMLTAAASPVHPVAPTPVHHTHTTHTHTHTTANNHQQLPSPHYQQPSPPPQPTTNAPATTPKKYHQQQQQQQQNNTTASTSNNNNTATTSSTTATTSRSQNSQAHNQTTNNQDQDYLYYDAPEDLAAGWNQLLYDAALPRVVSLLASTLEALVVASEIALANAGADAGSPEPAFAVFHAARPPTIPILSYLERIHRYAHASPICFVAAFAYLDRAARRGSITGTLPLTRHNVHRLLMTSIMIAAKFLDDAFYNNAYYARVGGIATAEMNKLELHLLNLVDFRLHVVPEELRRYAEHLFKAAGTPTGMPYAMAAAAAVDTPSPVMQYEPAFAAMAAATATIQQAQQQAAAAAAAAQQAAEIVAEAQRIADAEAAAEAAMNGSTGPRSYAAAVGRPTGN
ncbi:cyclin [Pycnococcus provasolii]|mmetsp:Transcript_5705/g.14558  ORF Transcript_5705/g.14558 Transcript_5705/m.14558 type:complete len:400 (-) Transcript_5705:90-1289(-)